MILKLHQKLKSKKISSVEMTKHFLTRIKKDQTQSKNTNAYITVCEQEALSQAKAADELLQASNSVLCGIPLGIKDVLCTEGVKTTCASKILGDYKPPYDATAVARLRSAGSIFLGKLNMDEFAMGGSNENSAFGPVRNPVNLDYVAGGSSGGSAAAVKAGLAVATLGTDTGGSVRLPAAFTGIVGLKPTYGLVSRYGLIAFASSLDQIGPMTVDTEDAAILLSEIAGRNPSDPSDFKDATSHNIPKKNYLTEMSKHHGQKYKVGIPKEYFIKGIDPAIEKAVQEVRKKLEKAGHEIVEISLPHTQYSVAIYYIVAVSEASSNLARFDGVRFGSRVPAPGLTEMYENTRSLFGSEVKRRIILGTFALSSGYYDAYYIKACKVRRLVANDFVEAFKKVDVILAPISPNSPYKLGEKLTDPLKMYLNDIFTIPANLAGLPAISVPAGRDENNLPIAAQFIGKPFSEDLLFHFSQFVENEVYKEPIDNGAFLL